MAIVPTTQFLDAAAAQGIAFDEGDLEKLGGYLERLLETNKTMNLTAVRDVDVAWMRHIFDSLTLLPLLASLPDGARVIDVGSGGGLPGLPLAICMPALKFTLLEATGKKAVFLRDTATALGLTNVTVHAERAEVAGHDRGERTAKGRVGGHREMYDAVVARAVGRLISLVELTVPFAKPPGGGGEAGSGAEGGPAGVSGEILLIKGQQADDELVEAAAALHALKAVHVQTLDTPTGRIVVLSKGAATPKLYPRRDGEPKRSPLGVKKEEVLRRDVPPRKEDAGKNVAGKSARSPQGDMPRRQERPSGNGAVKQNTGGGGKPGNRDAARKPGTRRGPHRGR